MFLLIPFFLFTSVVLIYRNSFSLPFVSVFASMMMMMREQRANSSAWTRANVQSTVYDDDDGGETRMDIMGTYVLTLQGGLPA